MRVLGIDPGLASIGLAVVESGARPIILDARLVTTAKADKVERAHVRVANDDARRLDEICAAVCDFMAAWPPDAVALEVYSVAGPRGGGAAAKVAMVYGALYALAYQRKIVVVPLRAQDRTREIVGRKSATKAEVEAAVRARAVVKDGVLDIAKSKREHVVDAAALALVGLAELARLQAVLHRATSPCSMTSPRTPGEYEPREWWCSMHRRSVYQETQPASCGG